MRLMITSEAKESIAEIAIYLEEESGSREVAKEFIAKLRNKLLHMVSLPFPIGRKRDDLRQNLYSYVFGKYIIFFEYSADVLRVILVIEGHRDIYSLFE